MIEVVRTTHVSLMLASGTHTFVNVVAVPINGEPDYTHVGASAVDLMTIGTLPAITHGHHLRVQLSVFIVNPARSVEVQPIRTRKVMMLTTFTATRILQ